MSVPIEKLQLRTILCERVFVKWMNPSGAPSTLGSCLYDNKQNPKFVMTVSCNREGYIHVHFSLVVSIKRNGKNQQMEMLFVVPPDANFASASTPFPISTTDDLSFLDASALHEAGISESQQVILLRFDLTAKGFVLAKKKAWPIIKPSNTTSSQLIRSLESLSDTTTFSAYMRPNSYAREGLKELCKRLSNTGAAIHKPNMKETYVQQGAMLVEWGKFIHQDRQDNPPPYPDNSIRPSPEVQVPQSPPIRLENKTNSFGTTIPETPSRTPITQNTSPVLHGIFSASVEEPLDSEVNLDNNEDVPSDIEEDLRDIDYFEPDSDEEFLANLNSRELSQQLEDALAIPKMLKAKLKEWLDRATTINPNVHEHKRLISKLSTLGHCIRTSNTRLFDATLPWCSALFFHNPFDSFSAVGLRNETNQCLISDMVRLIKWANEFRHGAEMNSLVMDEFVKLGRAARTTYPHPGRHQTEYERQKTACIICVVAEFGKSGVDGGGEDCKPVPRKRYPLEETHGNISKRAKNIQ
ncbi:hypothetical protein DSL72_001660 [Monilinia vaccinii-corymbosi]|uniref:Uncharacterized protein n=1 Tax=Monilinia vaccinii-corymbosi TaxID=61207 RepID=A0A8A3P811_9HELO|nr:hypothetical protein DSL72_001660 [Monilinia vaccinii-corymbosi]